MCIRTISLTYKTFIDNILSFYLLMRRADFRVYILSSVYNKMTVKRKPNWCVSEIEVLAQAVSGNIKVVKGKLPLHLLMKPKTDVG